jgi:prephenate dehydrogenase
MIERIAIIGLGLMGGSLARAIRQAGLAREIVGCGRNAASLKTAVDAKVIDRAETQVASAVRDAGLVVLAVPVGATANVLSQMAPALAEKAIITDVGSVKASVIADARAALGAQFPRFVGGHPLAGGEASGFAASHAELYRNSRVVLTPEPDTDPAAVTTVSQFWTSLGAQVLTLEAREHDAILARTSHLPHVLAFALMNTIGSDPGVLKLAGNGLRDMTRIAASDTVMWRDICLSNRDAIATAAQSLRATLDEVTQAMTTGDAQALEKFLTRARMARRALGDTQS